MTSDEGLNAYGALTWGQFFIYQGFNERAGWMHTSSGVDNIDEYLETVTKKGDGFTYRYGAEERPVDREQDHRAVQDRDRHGAEGIHRLPHASRTDRPRGGRQVDQRPPDAGAAQGAARSPTRARRRRTTRRSSETMELHTNSSNNTIYADADGSDRATSTSNFIPKRDPKFDWTKPVDGSDPATEWNGVLSIDETPGLLQPGERLAVQHRTTGRGRRPAPNSPKKADYPGLRRSRHGESPRGVHAHHACSTRRRTSRSTR